MKIVGIYGLFCRPSGKWYVGQSDNVYKRWGYYGRLDCKSQPKLYKALLKYGYESFEKIVIEECDNIDWILDYREMYWIRRLDSVKSGYNIREGGKCPSGWKLSEETKRKIGDCHRNNESFREKMRIVASRRAPVSTDTRIKCGIASRKRGPISEATKEKLRQAALRRGPMSDAHRENLRIAARSRPKATASTCEKRRLAALKRWHPNQELTS